MKTYIGSRPAFEPDPANRLKQGPAGAIIVVEGAETRHLPKLPGMEFGWGAGDIRCGNTAHAILADLYGEARARPLYMRFADRAIKPLRVNSGFSLTEAEIGAIVADIEKLSEGNAQMAAAVSQEPMPIVSDVAGVDAAGKLSVPEVRG